jgi:glucose-6-phosphate 1-dehydrogenase
MNDRPAVSDALVLFGLTGDLAHKMIFPALYAMVKRGVLTVPVVGVASRPWSVAQLRKRVADSIKQSGAVVERRALSRLLSSSNTCPETTTTRRPSRRSSALGEGATPRTLPSRSPRPVRDGDPGAWGRRSADHARVIVEKPFGRDLASARRLNAVARAEFPEDAIFRIDHFLGKEAIMNILYLRFANSFLEPIWNATTLPASRSPLPSSSVANGRGAFYETAGCLRDVIQNHLFQIVALLAMEPPVYRGYGSVQTEKAKVFEAMRPLEPRDLVRGQYAGYRKEPHVARNSDVETFCAVRLFIDSWRWEGVPWYLRSGKCLPETAAEVVVELKPPPARLFADSGPVGGPANYVRFRLSPDAAIALAARVKHPGKEFVGDLRELYMMEELLGAEAPYERLLSDVMIGDGALFTREDAVEAAWAAVDPVLTTHPRALPYKRGTWGPKQADGLLPPHSRWHNPTPDKGTP